VPAAILALAVALIAVGCGSSSSDRQLSRSAAAPLRSDLDRIDQEVRDGNCTTAQQVTSDLQTRIDGLGGRVSRSLRHALAASADRLSALVQGQCAPATPVVTPPAQDTIQPERGKKEKTDKGSNKPEKPKKDKKETPQEVPPEQDGGSEDTPVDPGGNDQPPTGDTGGASP
jgi:hypothetical protein